MNDWDYQDGLDSLDEVIGFAKEQRDELETAPSGAEMLERVAEAEHAAAQARDQISRLEEQLSAIRGGSHTSGLEEIDAVFHDLLEQNEMILDRTGVMEQALPEHGPGEESGTIAVDGQKYRVMLQPVESE